MRKHNTATKTLLNTACSLPLLTALSISTRAADEAWLCKDQAEQILQRLQTEVVGDLDSAQLASANQIVIDVCQVREQQVEAQVEQAVQQVREEEQAEANAWLTEFADKPGNKRLKRKSQ